MSDWLQVVLGAILGSVAGLLFWGWLGLWLWERVDDIRERIRARKDPSP